MAEQPMVIKPGWQTTEFWLTLLAVIAGVIPSSGLFPEGSVAVKIAGIVVSVLAALGYGAIRGSVKKTLLIIPLTLALLAVAATGCANLSVPQQLARAHVALQAADTVALDVIGDKCRAEATACGKAVKPSACQKWVACDKARSQYRAIITTVDTSLAACNRLLWDLGVK